MTEGRSYASLTGSLLARKGGARPAMRPRPFSHEQMLDDLGWNDMGDPGDPAPEHVPSSIAGLTPAPKAPVQRDEPAIEAAPILVQPVAPRVAPPPVVEPTPVAVEPVPTPEEAAPPPVHVQQQVLTERFGAAEPDEPALLSDKVVAALRAPAKPAKVESRKPAKRQRPAGRKAAFTLRLDADRHLRLRLASAVAGKSAQHLVTAALDDFFETMPELGTVAQRLPARASRGN